jgi:rhamnose utilization protein RhaD (predicted bifunctional aldolase and dehydrogenase)
LQAAFGPTAPVAPYRHSGLALARACGHAWRQADPQQARGLVLAHHGALVCGASAGEAYERMLELANRAEGYLEDHGAPRGTGVAHEATAASTEELVAFARLRHAAGRAAGRKLIATRRDGGFIGRFARRADVATLTSQGPSTPGHSIWTKRVPQVGGDIAAFAAAYRDYLDGAAEVDCAPRIALDPAFGLAAFGVTKQYADIAAAVFVHDAAIMARAAALGGYATIEPHLMRAAELEYAGFEARVARDLPRAGEVHVVEQACERTAMIEALLAAGAAVVGLDANPAVECLIDDAAFLGLASAEPGRIACTAIIHAFGGVDHIEAAPAWRQALSPFLSLNDA